MNITVITFPLSAYSNYEELVYFKLNVKNVHNLILQNMVYLVLQNKNACRIGT